MKGIGIGNEVMVELSEYGKQVWENHAYSFSSIKDKDMASQVVSDTLKKINDNNILTTNLWEIMSVFGPTIMRNPFSSEIIINEKDLTDIQNKSLNEEKTR